MKTLAMICYICCIVCLVITVIASKKDDGNKLFWWTFSFGIGTLMFAVVGNILWNFS